jgi:hypothetical protein
MSITVLKDVLIEKGLIENYFEGQVPINLWRALKRNAGKQVLDFVEQPFMLSNGRPRVADIKIETRHGGKWVCVKDRPRGVSAFDKPGIPSGKGWDYFKIPKGTELPDGLAIVKDQYNSKFEATHYTIAPAYDMPLSQFKSKLNTLALSLIKEAI